MLGLEESLEFIVMKLDAQKSLEGEVMGAGIPGES
jgi:hypothetical protein